MKKIFLLSIFLLILTWVNAQVVFVVQPPSELSGSYDMTWAQPENGWGTADLNNPINSINGELAMAIDGTSADSLLCETVVNGDELVGKIAVLYRGECNFSLKALNAQNAGAIGVVVINNSGDIFDIMGAEDGPSVSIPVIMISTEAGAFLRPEIEAGGLTAYIGHSEVFNMLFWITEEGIPLANVNVTINAKTITSAGDGSVLFEGLAPSIYTFSASKFNYITHSGIVTIIDQDVEKFLAFMPLIIEIADTTFCLSTELTVIDDFAEYLWSTGDTTKTITITEGGNYSVIVYNEAGFPSEGSDSVPSQAMPYNQLKICMVIQDEELEKNVIVYEPEFNVGIDSVLIYRLNNQTSEYEWIGSNYLNALSVFIDMGSFPAQQNYQYKIAIRDTCSKISELNLMHRTMHLQASIGVNDEINLFWNAYIGFDYPNFGIYRSVDGGEYFLIANVPNNTYTYTDINPPSSEKKYLIRVEKDPPCNPQKDPYSYVGSNPVVLQTVSINNNERDNFNVYPNPASNEIFISSNNEIIIDEVNIYNQLGQRFVHLQKFNNSIDVSMLQSGIYIIELVVGESVIRKKLIIE